MSETDMPNALAIISSIDLLLFSPSISTFFTPRPPCCSKTFLKIKAP